MRYRCNLTSLYLGLGHFTFDYTLSDQYEEAFWLLTIGQSCVGAYSGRGGVVAFRHVPRTTN